MRSSSNDKSNHEHVTFAVHIFALAYLGTEKEKRKKKCADLASRRLRRGRLWRPRRRRGDHHHRYSDVDGTGRTPCNACPLPRRRPSQQCPSIRGRSAPLSLSPRTDRTATAGNSPASTCPRLLPVPADEIRGGTLASIPARGVQDSPAALLLAHAIFLLFRSCPGMAMAVGSCRNRMHAYHGDKKYSGRRHSLTHRHVPRSRHPDSRGPRPDWHPDLDREPVSSGSHADLTP